MNTYNLKCDGLIAVATVEPMDAGTARLIIKTDTANALANSEAVKKIIYAIAGNAWGWVIWHGVQHKLTEEKYAGRWQLLGGVSIGLEVNRGGKTRLGVVGVNQAEAETKIGPYKVTT